MISHDLGVVEHMSDRVAVMYLGKIVETGDWRAIFESPGHPYTRGLMAAIPDAFAPASVSADKVRGEIPSPFDPPTRMRVPSALPDRGRQMPRDAGTRTAAARGGPRGQLLAGVVTFRGPAGLRR